MLRSLVLLLAVGCCSIALARAPRKIALNYTRSADAGSCIDPRELAQRVETYTGPVLVAPATADVALEAHVDATATGYVARISMGAPGDVSFGERTLTHAGKDCRAFAATLAFVIATTIDPDLVLETVGAMFGANEAEAQLLEELDRTPPRPVVLEPSTELGKLRVLPLRRPPRLTYAGGGGFAFSDESIRAGWGLTASLRMYIQQRWLLMVAPRFTTAFSAIDTGEARARTASFNGDLLACVRQPVSRRIELALCTGPELSGLRARGIELNGSKSGWALAGSATLRPEVSLQIGQRKLSVAPFVSWNTPERHIAYERDLSERVRLARAHAFTFGALVEVLRVFPSSRR